MFFKKKNGSDINDDQIKLIEAAQKIVKQKKRLFYHFTFLIFGAISLLTINLLFEYKKIGRAHV